MDTLTYESSFIKKASIVFTMYRMYKTIKKKTGEAENTTQDLRDASGPSIEPSNVH